jgi:GntR family transcriptional regulator of abcA and norABC
MEWKPDASSPIPMYKQIINYIKEKISRGEWPVGYKLPAERVLAQQLGVNRSTVTTAFAELVADGVIEARRGSGTRVLNNTWTLLAAASPLDWYAYVQAGIHQPNLATIQEINRAEFIPGIIRLGTGEMSPELFPAEAMEQIFGKAAQKMTSLGYEEPQGSYTLRQAISQHVQSLGIYASPSSILIVSGALQALHLISIGLLPRHSIILLEKPSYLYSVRVFQSAGMQLAGIPEMTKSSMLHSSVTHWKKKHNAALFYAIPSFHNPTGKMMSEEMRSGLIQACEQERLPVIEDDVYGELWLDHPPPLPLKAREKTGLVLDMGSLSKTLSPGLRIGWLIGPEPVIQRLADIKMQTDYGASSLSQLVVEEWLTSGLYQEHLFSVREKLKERREVVLNALEKHMRGLATWEVPSGGFYIWLRLLVPVSLPKLFKEALRQGILLNTGNIYDPDEREHIRLSYAYASYAELREGIYRLSLLIRKRMMDKFL